MTLLTHKVNLLEISESHEKMNYSISIGIYFKGDKLDPRLLTESLGVSPTKQQKNGEVVVLKTGEKVKKNIGLWAIVSNTNSPRISDHFDQIKEKLEKIASCRVVLLSIPNIEEAYIDLFVCSLSGEEEVENIFCLDSKQLKLFSDLNLELRVTSGFAKE